MAVRTRNGEIQASIRDFIEKKGIKQYVIAERAGMPTMNFNAMLNGKRCIYAHELYAICDALEVPVETFRPHEKAS